MVSRRIVGNLQSLHDRLRGRAKIDTRGRGQGFVSSSTIPPPPFPATYLGSQEPNSTVDTKFRVFATSVLTVLRRITGRRIASNLTVAQKCGLREVQDLVSSGAIRVTVSDKGGEFVVLSNDTQGYHEITPRRSNDL